VIYNKVQLNILFIAKYKNNSVGKRTRALKWKPQSARISNQQNQNNYLIRPSTTNRWGLWFLSLGTW